MAAAKITVTLILYRLGSARIYDSWGPYAWGTLERFSTSTSPGTLMNQPSSKNVTVFSSGCPTCVTISLIVNSCPLWWVPCSSRTSVTVIGYIATSRTKTYNASSSICKFSSTSKVINFSWRVVSGGRKFDYIGHYTWAGRETVSWTNYTPWNDSSAPPYVLYHFKFVSPGVCLPDLV